MVDVPNTTLQKVIPSYLYTQYADDDDLQAFVISQNNLSQSYIDWFNQNLLPVYTSPAIYGLLLDWIGAGLYGMPRPTLVSGKIRQIGPFNTATYNYLAVPYNQVKLLDPQVFYATSDDTYKRILTWHFFKGDGKVFNVKWLKRRVMRFLLGPSGTAPNIDQTYQVSVTFGVDNQVTIRLVQEDRFVQGGAIYNRFRYNTTQFNQLNTTVVPLTPLPNGEIFQEAVNSGALELPFQYNWTVAIS